MLAPGAAEGLGWQELDAQWSVAIQAARSASATRWPELTVDGTLGEARLYLARLTEPQARPAIEPNGALTAAVRSRMPDAPLAEGVVTPPGLRRLGSLACRGRAGGAAADRRGRA